MASERILASNIHEVIHDKRCDPATKLFRIAGLVDDVRARHAREDEAAKTAEAARAQSDAKKRAKAEPAS